MNIALEKMDVARLHSCLIKRDLETVAFEFIEAAGYPEFARVYRKLSGELPEKDPGDEPWDWKERLRQAQGKE